MVDHAVVGSRSSLAARGPADLSLLLLRLTLAVVFFAHGAQKVLGWFDGEGLAATIDHFRQNGSAALGWFVVFVEFVGPIAMLFGLLTRLAALGFVALMVGAIATVHWKFGFFMNWFGQQKGEGFEYHLLVIGIALALMVGGAGCCSLDRKFCARKSVT